MGRLTVPFRVKFNEKIAVLRKLFQETLVDAERREAFNKLVEAWSNEAHAMSYLKRRIEELKKIVEELGN